MVFRFSFLFIKHLVSWLTCEYSEMVYKIDKASYNLIRISYDSSSKSNILGKIFYEQACKPYDQSFNP